MRVPQWGQVGMPGAHEQAVTHVRPGAEDAGGNPHGPLARPRRIEERELGRGDRVAHDGWSSVSNTAMRGPVKKLVALTVSSLERLFVREETRKLRKQTCLGQSNMGWRAQLVSVKITNQ